MAPDIMEYVAGENFPHTKATLHGYQRKLVEGEFFPAIIAKANNHTEGVLYTGLTQTALQRLDRFEETLYQRHKVSVAVKESETQIAFAYVLRPEYSYLFSNSDWDPEIYLDICRSAFVE